MAQANNEGMIISLTCRGEELYRLDTKDFVEEISIGRNAECTWSVGHADNTTSDRHAMISRRKNVYYLTDLGSRNGIYLRDRKVKEIKLAPGMVLRFGECVLSVLSDQDNIPRKVKPHFLKYVNDNGKTVKIRLLPGTVKIGSGGKCNIVLNSGLVSTPHASIIRKTDGSCWIKDLNSRNGTSVNGSELPSKTERMLKNGDVISFADVDVMYYDGSSAQHVLKLTAVLATLLLTAGVCFSGYYIWLQLADSSQELLTQAREAARKSEFLNARDLIVSSASARNSGQTAAARKVLLAKIDTWEVSNKKWNELKQLLTEKKFSFVPAHLGTMELRYISAWDWNENEAVLAKKKIESIKEVFDCCNRLEMICNDPEGQLEQLTAVCRRLEFLLSLAGKNEPVYMQNMYDFVRKVLNQTNQLKASLEQFTVLAESMKNGKEPEIDKMIEEMSGLANGKKAAILSAKLEGMLPLLLAVSRAEKQLNERKNVLSDMRFTDCRDLSVDIPESKLHIRGLDVKIARIREENRKLIEVAAYMDMLFNALEKQGVTAGVGDIMTFSALSSRKNMEAAFRCDCFDFAPAARNRKTPVGKYDEHFGIEYLYNSLVMIRNYNISSQPGTVGFESTLEKAAKQIGLMEYFIKYSGEHCQESAEKGKLREYLDFLKKQLAVRDRIVQEMQISAEKYNASRREYFIAHGVSFVLKPSVYHYELRRKIGKEFAVFRSALQDKNREYNSVLAEDAIQIRNEILKTGFPGDPVVRRMWSLR